jgi:hypothetical protein
MAAFAMSFSRASCYFAAKFARVTRLGLLGWTALTAITPLFAQGWDVSSGTPDPLKDLALVSANGSADIVVDANDYPVVKLAADLFSADVERVTGKRPIVQPGKAASKQIILVGTLGHSPLIDQLAAAGKLGKLDSLRDHWETTLWQMVDQPFPGVDRAFVIVGSDRRGAAYGLMALSEKIGVSPWYWWADVPVKKQGALTISASGPEIQSPSVKYRGIFINDEDWSLIPWVSKTFDPDLKNIGPKTYEKVFELLLRLRLNYLWPAMHPCSTEFASIPENYQLADKYAIVMGSSHCEPMLQNNVWWPKDKGEWRYDVNHDNMLAYWEASATARGADEAVWTLGMRGIHDAPMQGPPGIPDRVALLGQAITDQRALIEKDVSTQWGPVAQCFIPYKEVLPLYDAGLPVPPDVTIVWTDDNFGYFRRLSAPAERDRPGGAGFYYHFEYYGNPRSYSWLGTTAPALAWEEMSKAWNNGAHTLWVINVGGLKPREVGIDFFSRLAWNADASGPDAQPRFLHDFAARTFGPEHADDIAALLGEFYRLGQIHKPEEMDRGWTSRLPADQVAQLQKDYQGLLDREKALAAQIPAESQDAWFELVGYPTQVLAAAGLVFMDDRLAQLGTDAAANQAAVGQMKELIDSQTKVYNEQIAGGKWRYMMPNGNLDAPPGKGNWKSIDWPWMDASDAKPDGPLIDSETGLEVFKGGDFSRKTDQGDAHWAVIEGLGHSGKAVEVVPASLHDSWSSPDGASSAPSLEYDFESKGTDGEAIISFLPTFRVYPGMKLRVAVSVDDAAPALLEVPGSSGTEDERGPVRSVGVRDNRVSLHVPLASLAAGKHTLKIRAVDPGAVIDEIVLP